MKGKVLAGYSLLEQIETNDRETIYIASARDGDGLVVIHVLSVEGNKAEGLQLLRDLRQLNNPSILSVIDYGETPWGTLYYVEPFHEGVSLACFIDSSGPILWVSAAVLLYEIARAISYSHGRGVAHRALTEDNIILDPGGFVRVQGLGISSLIQNHNEIDDANNRAFQEDIQGVGRLASKLVGANNGGEVEVSLEYRKLMELADGGEAKAMDVEAALARMLEEAGVSDTYKKLGEFFEEWSFFFLLNKTFVPRSEVAASEPNTAGIEPLTLTPSDESISGLDVEFFADDPSSQPDSEEAWDLDSETEAENRNDTDGMELEREQVSPPPLAPPKPHVSESEPPHDALERLEALHVISEKNRQKTVSLMVIIGAVVVALIVIQMIASPPSESELEERAQQELNEELGEGERKKKPVNEPTPEELAEQELDGLVASLRSALNQGQTAVVRDRLSGLDERVLEEDKVVVLQADLLRAEKNAAEAEGFLVAKWEEKKGSVVLTLALLSLYQKEKRWEDAAFLIGNADGRGMSSPAFYEASAALFREVGDLKQELRMLKREVAVRPDSRHRFRLGLLQEHFQLFIEARETYREIVMSSPAPDDGPFVGLLRVVEEKDFDSRGFDEVQSIFKKFPNHEQSQLYMAERHFSRGEYRESTKYLEVYEKKRPASWKTRLLRAGLALRKGEHENAIALYEALRLTRPRDAVVAHNLGIAYRAKGKATKAKSMFEAAVDLDGGLWQPHCELAQIYHRARGYSAAKKLYRRAYAVNKQHPWLREIMGLKLDSPKAGYLLEEMCYAPEIIESSRYELNKESVLQSAIR